MNSHERRSITSVGVVGLGAMGLPIALRLRACGYATVGYDTSEQAMRRAAGEGVATVGSAAQLAAATDLSLVLVGFDDQLRAVVLEGPDCLLSGAHAGHVIAIGSTVAPATSVEIANAVAAHDLSVVDTTLCRGEGPAAEGTLLVMAGGDRGIIEHLRPVLDSIASDVYHLGPVGTGQVGKMVNNYLLWLDVVGNFEGLRLAGRMGVDLDALRGALLESSGSNWALRTWQRSRPMPWAEKDMAIVLECADRAGLPMPAAATVAEAIKQVKSTKNAWAGGTEVRSSMEEFLRAVEGGEA